MKIVEIESKSILVGSKLPDADYVINPYTGCAFGCAYCYASFMGKYVGEEISSWGDYVYVKTNAVELARKEVAVMIKGEKRDSTLLLSSVTDPYQGIESKYRLTRGILEVLVEAQWPGRVGILTKSPLVTRDVDVLGRLPNVEVGLTVTTTDDEISKWLEVRAPKATSRIKTLRKLSAAGLKVYAFVGPLLPHFREHPELLDGLLGSLAESGVRDLYIEHANLKTYIRSRLEPRLADEPPAVQEAYVVARKNEHRAALDAILAPLLIKHGLRLRLDEVLYHQSGVAASAAHPPSPETRPEDEATASSVS